VIAAAAKPLVSSLLRPMEAKAGTAESTTALVPERPFFLALQSFFLYI